MKCAWILIPTLLGCGEPLTDASFRGEPLVEVLVEIEPEHSIPNDHLHLALFWTTRDATGPGTQALDTTIANVNLPSRKAILLFDPPRIAPDVVGRMLLFRDRDADGQLSAGDDLHGGVPGVLVLDADCPTAIGWRAQCDAPCEAPPAKAGLDPALNFVLQPFCGAL